MKFSLILHFLIGLYMYSNSSILTSDKIGEEIMDSIHTDNRYFNRQRFSNLHVIIFLCAFGLLLAVILVRCTLYAIVKKCIKSCKKISQRFLKDETQISDDIIEELNFPHLWEEFKKTKFDLIDFR